MPSDHQAADMAFLENAPVTGEINDVVAAATGRSFSGEPQNRALSAAAALIPLANIGTLRRALKMCTIELDDLADSFSFLSDTTRLAGDYDADWWIAKGARVLDPSEYPPSPFPVHRQPNEVTCGITCGQIAEEGLTGLPSDLLDVFLDTVTESEGITLSMLEQFLRGRGWNVTKHPEQFASKALPKIEQALLDGKAVIVGVDRDIEGVLNHAVLVLSITRTGPGNLDWIVTVNDPGIGGVVLLDASKVWSTVTGGQTLFMTVD